MLFTTFVYNKSLKIIVTNVFNPFKHKSHNGKIASLSDLMYQRQYTDFTIVAFTVVLWSMNNFVNYENKVNLL